MQYPAILCALVVCGAVCAYWATRKQLDVARFDERGNLLVPENLDELVFIGSSLGMGYSQENFDPDSCACQ